LNKLLIGKKLKLKLILAILFSLLISFCSFVVLEIVGESVLDNYLSKSTFIEQRQKDALERFIDFVKDEKLSSDDEKKLSAWVGKERYLNLYIFSNEKLIYSSNTLIDPLVSEQLLTHFVPSKIPITTVSFKDREAQVYMVGSYEYQYYNLILIIGISLAAITFIISFLLIINKKTSYIGKLEREIKILEGGNLDYPITITGKDELSSLAQSLDEMRKSFMERLDNEEQIRLANRELITAISHDLRTPLTILLGYMDIIQLNKYKTQEDLLNYIHNSREKAYQIKALSDKLFEYFTVSSASEAEEMELETYEGGALLDQLIHEQLFVPSREGFQFQVEPPRERFMLEVNLVAIRRVFDNIFSNVQKYADPSHPVTVKYFLSEQTVHFVMQNRIKRIEKKGDSNEIGLISSRKMIQQHDGTLTFKHEKGIFTLEIVLPIILYEEK